MQTATTTSAHQDEQAVAAVRRGDPERYRELVERHERRVFAVAWSRLGDASLAEEATQEAFIRGYRHLALLGEGAKFSPWITAIVRHVAISLGLRHRRELTKRERWALEQTPTTEPAREETELCTPETLRQTLAELPSAHRECLVLFYFEGKSGTEAADALGISESAFRVRLHRARAALRERLEERLGDSLEHLRPSRPIVPSVMGAILSSSTAKAAGGTGASIGGTVLSVLGKVLPFKFILSFFWLVGVVPGLVFTWWMGRLERRNYRDAEGFRPRLHREFYRRQLLVIAAIMFVSWGILFPIFRMSDRLFGGNACFLLLSLCSLVLTGLSARRFTICRNRFQIGMFVYVLVLTAAMLTIGLGLLPIVSFNLFMVLAMLAIVVGFKDRPLRMDYNFFLRARQGMLGASPAETPDKEPSLRLAASDLRAFACFLGTRWLVVNYRWEEQVLVLQLPRVNQSWRGFHLFWRGGSRITLAPDGMVSAFLGDKDERKLRSLSGQSTPSRSELEAHVASAVERAWHCFRKSDLASAERALGQIPDAEVFVVPQVRSAATRWYIGATMVLLAIMLFLAALSRWWLPSPHELKPVSVTEPEIRAALAVLSNGNDSVDGDLVYALVVDFVLPPATLFTPDALQAVRQKIPVYAGLNSRRDEQYRFSSLRNVWLLEKAMVDGWIGWNDVGVTPGQMADHLRQASPREWQFSLGKRLCRVDGREYSVERIHELILCQLRWLRDLNCLDLLDRKALIGQIGCVQVLSNNVPTGQPPLHNWRDARGLFFTSGGPVLQDTYCSLAALEILGGLDRIDREACIQGILRLHRGKGVFAPPTGVYELQVGGDARDTLSAFESLRILGALDRVKDLERWQFRPFRTSKPGASGGPRKVTWEEIEAWVCQQRLERFLRERKENPLASGHSLLEP